MSTEDSVSANLNVEKCSVVLVDVVGTTTSIGFAKETLFPYVNKNAEEFLKSKWDEEVVKNAVKELKGKDEELDLAAATKAVQELTEKDSDSKGLKALQGLIYGKGYEDGELKAHVFSDVPSCFESWAKVKRVAIYSTGSIESQKQLFSHTTEGDLTAHISNYFDQSAGPKTESESYKKISEQLEVKPEEIAFISDNVNEVKAAKDAGLTTALVAREGNEEIPKDVASEYTVISSFKDVVLENPAKRKIEEETTPEAPPSKVAKTESAEDTAAVEKNAQEKLEDNAMEVDSSSTEAKVDNKATEEVAANTEKTESDSKEKTESDSTEKTKTEQPTESVSDKDQTPMDTAVEKPVENAETKQESKTEETKEKIEDAEKKNVKEKSSEKSQEELVKDETENKSNETEAGLVKEEKDEEKPKEQVDGKTTSEATEENKDCVTESSVEDKVVEQKAVTNGEKTETKSETEDVKATEKAQKPEKETEQEVEKKNGVDSTNNEDTKTNSKDKDCPKDEDKTDAVVKQNGDTKDVKSEEKSTSEEKPNNTEEKENKSDLANVVENGKTEEPAVANGNAEGKLNGGAIQEPDSAIEEIKVKKIEAVPETAPSVSVEV